MNVELLFLCGKLFVALTFLSGAVSKWLNLEWFARVLLQYKILPRSLVKVTALLIPIGELAIALSLAFVRSSWPIYLAVLLILLFTVSIVVNMMRGRATLPCGCNGFWKKARIGWHLVGRNLGLCGLAYVAGPGLFLLRPETQIVMFGVSVALVVTAMLPVSKCGKRQNSVSALVHVAPGDKREWHPEAEQTI